MQKRGDPSSGFSEVIRGVFCVLNKYFPTVVARLSPIRLSPPKSRWFIYGFVFFEFS